ncbi:MAG: hypothetical protein FJ253_05050, partial [Phycisphaerae bacterium]|nr:hypothetical protein [Phycisphaerae bacterium]
MDKRTTHGRSANARRLTALATVLALAPASMAVISAYQTGEFYDDSGPVTRGIFRNDVWVKSLSVGSRTMDAISADLAQVSSARVYSAPADGGDFELVSDDQLGKPGSPIHFALGRDVDGDNAKSSLDVLAGYSLSRMLGTDGTRRLRVDVLSSTPQRDSDPDNDDPTPELILAGSLERRSITITPIFGGEVDDPVLGKPVEVPGARAAEGALGIGILMKNAETPFSMSIIGFDLTGDLGATKDQPLIGFRLEIGPG